MEVNNYLWRPSVETVVNVGETYYYSSMYGINIIKINGEGMEIFFSEGQNDICCAFAYSARYDDYIIFTPYVLDYLLVLNIKCKKVKKVLVPDRRKNEYLIPFFSKGVLCLFANNTSRIYEISKNLDIKVTPPKNDYAWKMWRQQNDLPCMCLWSEQSEYIECLIKDNKEFIDFKFLGERVCGVISNGIDLCIVEKSGMLYIGDLLNGNIKTFDRIIDGNLLCYNNMIYDESSILVLPVYNSLIKKILISGEIYVDEIDIECNMCNKKILWTVLNENKVFGIIKNIEDEWEDRCKYIEYNYKENKCKEIFIDEMINKYFYNQGFSKGAVIKENKINDCSSFVDFLSTIIK